MDTSEQYPAAPWSMSLKLISLLCLVLVPVVAVVLHRTIPAQGERSDLIRLIGSLAMPAVVLAAVPFVVTGYQLDGPVLLVHRLGWATRIDLHQLDRAESDPAACRHSLRLCGNGGLFSFTGLFRSRKLGNYRLFATDVKRAVVLSFGERKVVVTPKSPCQFLAGVARAVPTADIVLPTT